MIGGFKVKKNVDWQHGEIDILVYSSSTNTALQIQAKAPIPPQGARMTRQVESNTLKAINQLKSFDRQRTETKDRLLKNVFGLEVSNARWASAVLVSSSFGTSRAWSGMSGIAALNPQLLTLVMEEIARDGNLDLVEIPAKAARILDGLIGRSCRGWSQQTIEVFGTSISFPVLELDYEEIGNIQVEIATTQARAMREASR
jgi:hypothetical protein